MTWVIVFILFKKIFSSFIIKRERIKSRSICGHILLMILVCYMCSSEVYLSPICVSIGKVFKTKHTYRVVFIGIIILWQQQYGIYHNINTRKRQIQIVQNVIPVGQRQQNYRSFDSNILGA